MLISSHECAYVIDHVEPEPEIDEEQVQGVFGCPQASSYDDAIIVVIKASPDALTTAPCLLF
jgi:hypothetical protein